MSGFGNHLSIALALTSAVGVVLTRMGLGTGLLRQRHSQHRCPACGRLVSPRGCERCGS
jgi:hypothetical protein